MSGDPTPASRPPFSLRVRAGLERSRAVRPSVADGLLAAVLTAVAVGDLLSDQLTVPFDWREVAGLVATLVMGAAIAVRRRYPDAVMFVVGSVGGIAAGIGAPFSFFSALLIMLALYNIAAYGRWQDAVMSAGITIAVLTLLAVQNFAALGFVNTSINFLLFGLAFLIGYAMRTRQELADQLAARAVEEERRRKEEAERAVMAERHRIARELHDIVAHSVSVMVVQAGAARRVVERSPDKAIEAVGRIEETGRGALTEIRRLLGVLRDGHDDPDLAPQPGLGELNSLVESMREAGLPISLELSGATGSLAPGVDLTVYRLVQEALTNVLRHAGPVRTVDVGIAVRDEVVEVSVADDGSGAASGTHVGRGLVGMRERVDVLGGQFSSGPRRGGGWSVRAVLPRIPAARSRAVST